jgi:protein AaeX
MNFSEINLLGVYVAPISVMMVIAWGALVLLRMMADRFGLLHHVWHPSLFVFAMYMIILSSLVIAIGH